MSQVKTPPLALAAGVLLIVGGGLSVAAGFMRFDDVGLISSILQLLVGAGAIYGGFQVLGLREIGRQIGLALSGVGAAFALLAVFQGYTPAIASLILNGFVILALVKTADSFRRA